MRKINGQGLACLANFDRSVPRVGIVADIMIERQRRTDCSRLRLRRLHLLRRLAEASDLEVVKLLRPIPSRIAEIVVEQLVAEAEDDLAVLAIGGDENPDVLSG